MPLPWCTRCGTSLSQHEMLGSYVETEDLSLYVAAPLKDGSGRELVLWTTTPWTLPANVAAAVHPTLRYEEVDVGGRHLVMSAAAAQAARLHRRRGAAFARRRGARRPRVRDVLPRPPGAAAGAAHRDPVGRDRSRRGHRHRPHRAGLRSGGLRAQQGASDRGHHADRRAGELRRRIRLARRSQRRDRRRRDRRATARRGPRHQGRAVPAQRSRVLALQEPRALPARVRVVHQCRRRARADARRRAHGRVGPVAHRQPHGRLAAQHGRLVHLTQALLGPAAPLLPLRGLQRADRGRFARGAARARVRTRARRRAARAAPPVDRRHQDPLRVVRQRRRHASPRSATAGSMRASSRSRRSATSTIPKAGSRASRPSGSRRCASRCGSGSIRCCS